MSGQVSRTKNCKDILIQFGELWLVGIIDGV